jgi:hypothetical protein
MKPRKRIRKEELLFEVNDTKKIKLGKDLHIPMIDPYDKFDWNVESLLIALEIAEDKGFDLPKMPDGIISYEYSYYCKINGMTYKVTQGNKGDTAGYSDRLYEKIELIGAS